MLDELKAEGLTAVYLQFDGLKKETYISIRGRDLTEIRQKSIEAIRNVALCCTLSIAVARGINDHEIGDIVRFGIDNIDKDVLDEERINKCRYAITCEDGVFSFCAYNNLYRFARNDKKSMQTREADKS